MMSDYENDKPPKEVWLQFYEEAPLPDSEKEVAHPEDRSWSSDKVFRDDVRYVDAELVRWCSIAGGELPENGERYVVTDGDIWWRSFYGVVGEKGYEFGDNDEWYPTHSRTITHFCSITLPIPLPDNGGE